MMKSMTGFGRAQSTVGNLDVTVELRCVNHRYFDCSVKTPRMYAFLEDTVKGRVQKSITRGKVDVYVTIDHNRCDNVQISLNSPVLEGYLSAAKQMAELYGLKNDLTVSSAARLPDVFYIEKEPEDADALKSGIGAVVDSALVEFSGMREHEGARLSRDILERAQTIADIVEKIEVLAVQTVAEYRQRLFQRMKDVLENAEIDEHRILLEAALYADRVAVDEETVRLKSHLSQLSAMSRENGAVGRKMDFLIQELNREANTIGSKANDVGLSRLVVDMKAEIEKIREQVQNIE